MQCGRDYHWLYGRWCHQLWDWCQWKSYHSADLGTKHSPGLPIGVLGPPLGEFWRGQRADSTWGSFDQTWYEHWPRVDREPEQPGLWRPNLDRVDREAKHLLASWEQGGCSAARDWVDWSMSPRWSHDYLEDCEQSLRDWSHRANHWDTRLDTD